MKVYETGSTEDTATRKNNYYFRDWDPDTTSTASDYPEINIKEGTRVSDTKNAWIPAVSESPTYDANGNLTGDALWSYTYDEENRLITMTETSAAATAGFPDTTITFKYDYLGRRVEKKVVRGTTTESHLRFVWRGWLLVAELNAASNNALVKTYTWGPDISGSFGGAGGNGGVLMVEDHEADEKFFPAYDAQGNVTGLIDTSGNLVAAYEYDPFGKLIRYAGTRSTSMSLLYGTKYLDMETGLIYYGHRYYDPRQGRFINRDPIGEFGGLNLYGFVGNSPVNRIDFLGLCGSPPARPLFFHFDHRDDDERDRYEDALEDWEDDLADWLECRRNERISKEKNDPVVAEVIIGEIEVLGYIDDTGSKKNETETITLSFRAANLPGGGFADTVLGKRHVSVKTSEGETGQGKIGAGIPGQGTDGFAYTLQTEMVNHTDESLQPGVINVQVTVNREIFLNEVRVGQQTGI